MTKSLQGHYSALEGTTEEMGLRLFPPNRQRRRRSNVLRQGWWVLWTGGKMSAVN